MALVISGFFPSQRTLLWGRYGFPKPTWCWAQELFTSWSKFRVLSSYRPTRFQWQEYFSSVSLGSGSKSHRRTLGGIKASSKRRLLFIDNAGWVSNQDYYGVEVWRISTKRFLTQMSDTYGARRYRSVRLAEHPRIVYSKSYIKPDIFLSPRRSERRK